MDSGTAGPRAAHDATGPIHYIVAAWGERYVGTLLDIALPSQISGGNLGGLRDPKAVSYRIFTTAEDAPRIKAAPAVQALARQVTVDIVQFERPAASKYDCLAAIQRRAIAEAKAAGAGIVLLSPDIIVADGAFLALERLIAQGYSAVMVAAPRLYLPSFVPALKGYRNASEAITIGPRELVRLGLDHLHPITRSLFWGRSWLNAWPSALYWHLGQDALLARYWHMHPLFVRTDRLAGDFAERSSSTIDGDLLMSLKDDLQSIHIVTDSDEILVFELSDDATESGLAGRKPRTGVGDLVTFAAHSTNAMHRLFIQKRIFLHAAALDEAERFADLIAQSDRLIDEIVSRAQGRGEPRRLSLGSLFWKVAHRLIWAGYRASRKLKPPRAAPKRG